MRCPICKTPVAENPPSEGRNSYWPFCSERCKLIDLGRWLDGRYQIPFRSEDDESADDYGPARGGAEED